jgi:CHASE2 domain-containing sensor protein
VNKRAILRCDGSLELGFRSILEIGDLTESTSGEHHHYAVVTEVIGALPPALDLLELLAQWQQHYLGSLGAARIILETIGVQTGTLAEIEQCRNLALKLQQALTRWLASPEFRAIEQRLRETLTHQTPIELLLRSNDDRLHQLPWHMWEFIDRYPLAELIIGSPPEGWMRPHRPAQQVRILVILGDRQGIDTEADRQLLADLPQADVVFLVEPSRQDVYTHLWREAWDVLFFAGHSQTERQQGRIYLNPTESLTLDELRYGLRRAIERGLQLAIFNSCDGLGLAYELAQLHMPYAIVMRLPVPDRVAQTFLKQFLANFAAGNPLHTSVRQAREYLQGLEGDFPCASWLPVIFQNSALPPLTWRSLQGDSIPPTPPSPPSPPPTVLKPMQHVLWAIGSSIGVTVLIMGIRYLGLLQSWELAAFDLLMRSRPLEEKPDPRLLVVSIAEEDVRAQKQAGENMRGGSLSDRSLAKILKKLTIAQPIAIGLDIYRDNAIDSEVAAQLQAAKMPIVTICKISELGVEDPGVSPPPGAVDRTTIGFSDIPQDPDRSIRRHALFLDPTSIPNSPCQAGYGLSTLLALHYLDTKGIAFQPIAAPANPNQWTGVKLIDRNHPQIPKLTFPLLPDRLAAHVGAYQNITTAGQINLNYRATQDPANVAPQITMTDLLADKISAAQIKNRIVLIGTTAPSFKDYVPTPYQTADGYVREIPGVLLQAHMVSQLISAVEDRRPLIQFWAVEMDALWICGWAVGGGLLAIWLHRRPVYLMLVTGVGVVMLIGGSLMLLVQGFWVPLVPGMLAISISSSAIATAKAVRT